MPRRPNVGPDEILDRAMYEFWARGYRSVSMDSLARATGATLSCLYAEFGGKEGLFEAVLDRYANAVVTRALGIMAESGSGLAGIERYFHELVSAAPPEQLRRGCLMTTTMNELPDASVGICERTRAHFERVARAFEDALTRARSLGELPPEVTDVRAAALSLATLAQGIWACARAGVPAATLMSGVDATLRSLRAGTGRDHPAGAGTAR